MVKYISTFKIFLATHIALIQISTLSFVIPDISHKIKLPGKRIIAKSHSSILLSSFDESSDDYTYAEADTTPVENEYSEEFLAKVAPWDENIPPLNSVTLTGRIGNNPEPKYLEDGTCVLNLSLAVRRKYHPYERQARNITSGTEETDWFPLELWGRDAEYAARFVSKGARVGITGGLTIDSWNDRETGVERQRAKIIVKQLDILETKAEAELRKKGNSFGGY